jgi:hypothetical protein
MTIYASDLLESVKSTVLVPGSQVTTPNAQILKFADDKIRSTIVPMIKGVRQDYFLRSRTVQGGADVQMFRVPDRAIGRTLKNLKLVNGNTTRDMAKISVDNEHVYMNGSLPVGFFFIGDDYKVIPKPSATDWSLVEWYLLQPSALVESTDARQITGVSVDTIAGTTTISVSGLITGWASGVEIDLVRGTGSGQIIELDLEIGSTSPTSLVFNSDEIDVQTGDWVCNVKESPIVQLPDECFEFLTVLTAQKVLEAESDYDGARALGEKFKSLSEHMLELIAPRVEDKNDVLLSRNNLVRRSRRFWNRRFIWP